MKKRIISFLTSLVMVISLVGVVPSMTVSAASYNSSAAVSYATQHWNDGKGLCAEFVSNCLSAGGVSSPWSTSCGTLINNLVNGGYGTKYALTQSGGTIPISSNSGKLSSGDPIFYYCNTCHVYPHVVLCGGSSNGKATAYAHNSAWNNKIVYTTFSSGAHKGHSMTLYSIHMNNTPNPPSIYNLNTEFIYDNSARVAATISKNGSNWSAGGVYIGTSPDNMSWAGGDGLGSNNTWLAYTISNLTPGTTYYYKFYVQADGNTYWSNVSSFTTTGHTHSYTTNFSTNCYSKKSCSCGNIIENWNNNYYDGVDIFYARLKSLCNGKYLGISNTTGGTDVDTYGYNVEATSTSNTSLETLWKFEKTSDGYYHISSYKNSYCLDVFLAKDVNCANIQAYSTYSGNNNQQWRLYKNGSYFNLKPKHSNRCLDIYGGADTSTNANIYEYNDTNAQKFTLEIHNHSYTEKITKQPTCTATGEKTLTCSICGETKTETIPATGHNYTEKIVAPTLKEQGYTLHKCSVCGDEYKDNYVKPLCETELKYQLANLGDDKWAVRFLLVVDEQTVLKAQNASIFLTRNNGANTKAIPFKTAYRKVKAGGKTISAGEGKVFLTAMYNNIPVDEMYNLKATLNIDQDIYYRTITENLPIDKTVDTPTHNTVEDEDIFD